MCYIKCRAKSKGFQGGGGSGLLRGFKKQKPTSCVASSKTRPFAIPMRSVLWEGVGFT